MQTQRLILADDHPVVRQGLRGIVERAGGLSVVGEAGDGPSAELLARRLQADLLVLDVTMPGCSGIQVLQSLRRDGIPLPVLFYTMVPVPQYAGYLQRAGAQGIVGKDADEAAVLQAIQRVLRGRPAFPAAARHRAGPAAALSLRENQVLQGLLEGKALVAIAAELDIGAASVSTYRRRILDKLDAAGNVDLMRIMRP